MAGTYSEKCVVCTVIRRRVASKLAPSTSVQASAEVARVYTAFAVEVVGSVIVTAVAKR
jgi:hypothetical protein